MVKEESGRRAIYIGLIGLLTTFFPAEAEVNRVHLSWSINATDVSTTVCWMSPAESQGLPPGHVQYGLTATYGLEQTGRAVHSRVCDQFIHEVVLSGLDPGTEYHYRCGSPGDWSEDHTFRTAPRPGSHDRFTFVAYGDTRTDWWERKAVRDAIITADPDFILHVGAVVAWGSLQYMWDVWFDQMESLIANRHLMPTIGNHDLYGCLQNYLDQFALPELAGTEHYYSFDYGNMHIVSMCVPTETTRVKPGTEQYDWLTRDLQRAGSNPDILWKVVYFHVPLYSAGFNYPDLRTDIAPILDACDVDLCFAGHIHNYERTYMLYGQAVTDSGPRYNGSVNDGTVYIVTGGGCAPLMPAGSDWWTASSASAYSFCLVEAAGSSLTVNVVYDDGTKMEAWSISREPESQWDPTIVAPRGHRLQDMRFPAVNY